MSATEGLLLDDLSTLSERLADEKFATELYRALAGGRLTKDGASFAPSWGRAEEIVNRLRVECDQEPLTLAQTGGEGELSGLVGGELESLGWTWKPRDTSHDDPAHTGRPESPPPADAGERAAPVGDSHEWEQRAHREADAAREQRDGPPKA